MAKMLSCRQDSDGPTSSWLLITAAAHRPLAEAFRGLPCAGGYDALGPLARGKIGTETNGLCHAAIVNAQREWCARVPVPSLDSVDAVPVRALTARQQEIDRGRGGATAIHGASVAERLAIVPALRVGLEIEQPDDVLRGQPFGG